jgi:hypothetical protein
METAEDGAHQSIAAKLADKFESALRLLSVAGGPFLLAAFAAISVLSPPSMGPAIQEPAQIRAWEQGGSPSGDGVAPGATIPAPALTVATHRSTKPFWIQIDLSASHGDQSLFFPSRHAKSMACFDRTGARIGSASRAGGAGLLKPLASGFVLSSPPGGRAASLPGGVRGSRAHHRRLDWRLGRSGH